MLTNSPTLSCSASQRFSRLENFKISSQTNFKPLRATHFFLPAANHGLNTLNNFPQTLGCGRKEENAFRGRGDLATRNYDQRLTGRGRKARSSRRDSKITFPAALLQRWERSEWPPGWDLGVGGGGGGPEQRERVVLFGILTWKVVGKEF